MPSYITIPNSMLSEATPLAVMLYADISVYAKYAVTEKAELFMPREKLQHDLYEDKGRGAYQVRKTLEGIEELESLEVLRYDKELRGVFIKKEALYPDKYVMISSKEMDTIKGNTESGYFQWLLFDYYCHLVDSFNSHITIGGRRNVIGFMPQQYFADKLDLRVSTIREYNTKLVELGILYIAHRKKKTDSAYKNNIYCRHEDRNLLNNYLTELEN